MTTMLETEIDPYMHSKISPVTKKNYMLAIEQFKRHSGIEDLREVEPKILKQKLIQYIIYLKERKQSYSKQNIAISAVQKYYAASDREGINWSFVRGHTSDNDINTDDEPYSRAQLQSLVAAANPRTKAIILTMLSAGLRIGSVPLLKIKHAEKMDKHGVYKIQVYADSKKSKYTTFVTPEAAKAIDAYLLTRTIKGEKLKPDSPLFRQEFDAKNANSDIRSVNKSGLFKLIQELAVNVGIRKLGVKARGGHAPRHGIPLTHSFRKIANTAFVRANVKAVVCEMLLGHNVGLQANYLRLSEEELFSEYAKAIDLLTVSEEKVLQEQVGKLQLEVADVGALKQAYLKLKLESERQQQQTTEIMGLVMRYLTTKDQTVKDELAKKMIERGGYLPKP